ncbi:hypothetical protein DFH08DRAFT_1085263 [Mycena albidolilacea]|uniref:Uncharacterized protein n=1 Tax=Mycena albidolilacea TaxID=1033008 RepID=A0AAD6ZJB7_9AGAR|nr:hypothetical protein DFH08DRAFT_1085263 [Mycena albidolilacea]
MLVSLRARSGSLDPQIYPRLILGLLIPGLVLTAALLALFGYAAWNIVSRRYLDRVSFRLLAYTLVVHLIFGVSLAMNALGGYSDWRCSFLTFATDLSLLFSSCIFFCMALNVPLVVVYNISGQALEKYYVAGTTFFCLICNVPPYASGNLGHVLIPTEVCVFIISLPYRWDVESHSCWYNSADAAVRFRWVVGTQTSWLFIMAGGEVVAFLIIIGYLVTHEFHLLRRSAPTEATYSSEGAGSTILKFRNIILRIGLYPHVSCLLSVTAGGVDLYESRKYKMETPESKLDNELMLVSMASYAARPLIYGLLAATDPSFIRALYALRHPDAETETQFCRPSGCLSTIVEIPPHVISFDDAETLDNDHARPECMLGRESSIIPPRDLEGGKKRQSYFGRGTSGATTRLSVDVGPYHI